MAAMWNLFNCYLSGRHDYGMWCEPGQIFLRCVHCGKRSAGWEVERKAAAVGQPRVVAAAPPATGRVAPPATGRVVPFSRAVAR
jgi:hypothetical protein